MADGVSYPTGGDEAEAPAAEEPTTPAEALEALRRAEDRLAEHASQNS